eukprot:1160335-Pelagomonas_calceolata.AAC.11
MSFAAHAHRIQVYDSLYAPARPFLLTRVIPEADALPADSSNGTSSTSNSTSELPVRSPGQSGRWKEGEDDTVSQPSLKAFAGG